MNSYTKTGGLLSISVNMRPEALGNILRDTTDIALNSVLSPDTFHKIGKAGVLMFQETLEPLERTGRLRDSFTYQVAPNSVTIYSDFNSSPYGAVIENGYKKAGSYQKILIWMGTVQDQDAFPIERKERMRVAYAIKVNIDNQIGPGEGSDIGPLNPVGERRFKYMDEVVNLMSAYLDTLLQRINIKTT